MNQFERRDKIIELINKNGKVKVNELAEMFDISDVSIRTDLADLETKGLLSRVHGGAVSSYKTYYNMDMQQRLLENRGQKELIASKIAGMIEENDTIMFNSGTTTLTIMRKIPQNMNLSIVTNSIAIALEASGNPNFNVVLLGGAVNSKYQFVYGDNANTQLTKYHADKLILSVDGISPSAGFTTFYDREAEIDRLMLEHSATKIIAADSSKLGRTAFAHIAPLDMADYIITNSDESKNEDIASAAEFVSNIITL